MRDKICIKGLKILSNHGVLKKERQGKQVFIIDIAFFIDTDFAALGDAYDKTVCYNEVCKTVYAVSEQGPYNLIETFAEKISASLLQGFAEITAVDINVKKPDAPVDFDISYASVSISRKKSYAIALGLGSNIGDGETMIDLALAHIRNLSEVQLTTVSSYHQTKPEGKTDQDDFTNACAIGSTTLEPEDLLQKLKQIELNLGRIPSEKWGPRVIDIDILCFGGLVRKTEKLTIPHPQMLKRAFVLAPLNEIAPGLKVGDKTISEYLQSLQTIK